MRVTPGNRDFGVIVTSHTNPNPYKEKARALTPPHSLPSVFVRTDHVARPDGEGGVHLGDPINR